MDIKSLHSVFLECKGVLTDSRSIKGGEMFFALKGERFDGNEYALKALEAGAAYAVVNEGAEASSLGDKIISVPDTLKTLQELARYHRENTFVNGSKLIVIGLTGTNGKTTTKELIREVLSVKFRVTATEGNLNNDIGVPLSLLRIDRNTQVAVIEMGANHPEDIAALVSICKPDYGLITNVGKAHLEGFGGFDGVKKAKGRLYDYISAEGKAVFLNSDDPVLCGMASERKGMNTILYGLKYSGIDICDDGSPFLRLSIPSDKGLSLIETHLVGKYNADNIMAALAVGNEFGISLEEAVRAIEAYVPSNSRSQFLKTKKNILIIDAYNANPSSMSAALDNFSNISSPLKAALLGDMLELGEASVEEHLLILKKAGLSDISKLFLVGNEFRKALELKGVMNKAMWFETSEELSEYLKKNGLQGYIILVKGSRGTMMEKTLAFL